MNKPLRTKVIERREKLVASAKKEVVSWAMQNLPQDTKIQAVRDLDALVTSHMNNACSEIFTICTEDQE